MPAHVDLAQALASWPETATAVAVRLTGQDQLKVVAPYGLDDLFALRLRPSPLCRDTAAFAERLARKGFLQRWPRLRVV